MVKKKAAPKATKPIILSGIMLLIYGSIFYFVLLRFPNAKELLQTLEKLYATYGYGIIFLSAIIEGLFLVGNYIPGTAAILLGAAIAKSGKLFLPFVILLGTAGLLLSYCVNYFLGKYGWYHVLAQFGMEEPLRVAEEKLKKHGKKAIAVGYISPNGGAILSTAAGIVKMPFKRFLLLSIPSQLFWSTAWGSIAYIFGHAFVEFVMKYLSVIVMSVIFVWLLSRFFKKTQPIP
jgi:membrane-associated protein